MGEDDVEAYVGKLIEQTGEAEEQFIDEILQEYNYLSVGMVFDLRELVRFTLTKCKEKMFDSS